MALCIPQVAASLFSKRLLPRRIAHSLFCRSAGRSTSYKSRSITSRVHFGPASFTLDLPLRFRQNWTLLFEDFDNEADGLGLRLFRHYARTSRFIFDVGMNAGLYLYHAAAVRPEGARVYGFEPNRELADMVSANVARNAIRDVEVINKCVAAEAGAGQFFLTNTEYMNSLSEEFLRSKGRPVLGVIEVPLVRIDDFVSRNGIGADLLKIDVEGFEPGVIAGAWQTIRTHRPVMLIEIADSNLKSEFVGDLLRLGYRSFHLLGRRLVEIERPERFCADRVEGHDNYLFTINLDPELERLTSREVI